MEYIYFIIGLLHRGIRVSVSGFVRGGGTLSHLDYVNTYCFPRSQKSSTQIPIVQTAGFLLKVIVRTITHVTDVLSLHLDTPNHMHLGVQCLRNIVFDWCSILVINMKKQLTDCNLGNKNNFKYPSILVAFFFKQVPTLSPTVVLPHPHPRDPRLTRWGDVFV